MPSESSDARQLFLMFISKSHQGGCFVASPTMSGIVFAFTVLTALFSTMQVRAMSSEQLETELRKLMRWWPDLVRRICAGKRPDQFLRSEVGCACIAGVVTSIIITLMNCLVVYCNGPAGVFQVCVAMGMLGFLIFLRATYLKGNDNEHSNCCEGMFFLFLHNVLEVALLWQMTHVFDTV